MIYYKKKLLNYDIILILRYTILEYKQLFCETEDG